jgi:hypothetical protein
MATPRMAVASMTMISAAPKGTGRTSSRRKQKNELTMKTSPWAKLIMTSTP